jgi:hypothetical protein
MMEAAHAAKTKLRIRSRVNDSACRPRPAPSALGIALLMVWAGCSNEVTPRYNEGDPCRTILTFCVDADVMMACVNGNWSEQECSDFCAKQAPGVESAACESANAWDGACSCVPPPGGCIPGESVCADDQSIEYCAEDWQWSTATCTEVCAEHPPYTISLGCMLKVESESAACSCTAAGTSCNSVSPLCVDDSTLAICEGGIWTHLNCTEFCGGDATACIPGVGTEGSCKCG